MTVVLATIGLLINANRLGADLAGGRLLPVRDLAATWSGYLASWHPVAGGTSAPAPPALAVVGVLGLLPGGPPAAVAVLFLADLPLAGLSAYCATRRLHVWRPIRAILAAAYALLPPAVAAVAQGRLDVVVVHLLLPMVVCGGVAVLRDGAPGSWIATAAGTSLGLAVIGAFSPLIHLALAAGIVVGFVAIPGRRRTTALFAVTVLPVVLLMPWSVVPLRHPEVLLHGAGAEDPGHTSPVIGLVTLDPGGPGAPALVGVLLVLSAVVAAVVRPSRLAALGLGMACCGAFLVGLLVSQDRWSGSALVVESAGLLLAVSGACVPAAGGWRLPRRAVVLAAAGMVVGSLGAGALIVGGRGPLHSGGGPRFAPEAAAELARTGCSVLDLDHGGQPSRQVGGGLAGFGDDDLVFAPDAPGRLARLTADLTTGPPQSARAAVVAAALSGVSHIVLPDMHTADRLLSTAGDLAAAAQPLSDGRPVVRVRPASAPAVMLSPRQVRWVMAGGAPPAGSEVGDLVPVPSRPPDVAVRTADGPPGRLLLVGAQDEPGWRATVDGHPVPLVRTPGQLVAVSVPAGASDVRVEQPRVTRDTLLLVQAAFVLFTVVAALPRRIRRT